MHDEMLMLIWLLQLFFYQPELEAQVQEILEGSQETHAGEGGGMCIQGFENSINLIYCSSVNQEWKHQLQKCRRYWK